MSDLADQLFATAQSLQSIGATYQQQGDGASKDAALQLFGAAAVHREAATQENALLASAALSADARTVTQIETITRRVDAQSSRLASIVKRVDTVVSIAGNILKIVEGASDPLSVLPLLNTVVGELSS